MSLAKYPSFDTWLIAVDAREGLQVRRLMTNLPRLENDQTLYSWYAQVHAMNGASGARTTSGHCSALPCAPGNHSSGRRPPHRWTEPHDVWLCRFAKLDTSD